MRTYIVSTQIRQCQKLILVIFPRIVVRECNGTDVRLVDGRTALDGQVDICLKGLWAPICDAKWDDRDAEVVCRQRGYNGSELKLIASPAGSSLLGFCKWLRNVITLQPPILCTNIMATSLIQALIYYLALGMRQRYRTAFIRMLAPPTVEEIKLNQ